MANGLWVPNKMPLEGIDLAAQAPPESDSEGEEEWARSLSRSPSVVSSKVQHRGRQARYSTEAAKTHDRKKHTASNWKTPREE